MLNEEKNKRHIHAKHEDIEISLQAKRNELLTKASILENDIRDTRQENIRIRQRLADTHGHKDVLELKNKILFEKLETMERNLNELKR